MRMEIHARIPTMIRSRAPGSETMKPTPTQPGVSAPSGNSLSTIKAAPARIRMKAGRIPRSQVPTTTRASSAELPGLRRLA